MTRALVALLAGTIFGFGLSLGGMLDPATIRGFLDFFDAFDPRLGFVFAGAVGVSAAGYFLSRCLAKPLAAPRFSIPEDGAIDGRLLGGAALFGAGWGAVGLCPGPAIAGLALGVPQIFIFTVAMFAGVALYAVTLGARATASAPAE